MRANPAPCRVPRLKMPVMNRAGITLSSTTRYCGLARGARFRCLSGIRLPSSEEGTKCCAHPLPRHLGWQEKWQTEMRKQNAAAALCW